MQDQDIPQERKQPDTDLPSTSSVTEELYTEQKADKLFFVMERLSEDNESFWYQFITANKECIRKYGNEYSVDGGKYSLLRSQNALDIFKEIFLLRNRRNQSDEFWIAYITIQPVSKAKTVAYKDIEMAMLVGTAGDLPFTSHQGIFRTPKFIINMIYKENKNHMHKNISVAFHAFAARTMLKLHPEKVYMINTPAKEMREILIKALPAETISVEDTIYNTDLVEEHLPVRSVRIKKIDKKGGITILDKNGHSEIGHLSAERKKEWFRDMGVPYVAIDLNALSKTA
ncbi:hypothetical protein [Candidatus Cardinium hertigii]|nr:hypothetical protein [Candidatus Cardinium hertigii]